MRHRGCVRIDRISYRFVASLERGYLRSVGLLARSRSRMSAVSAPYSMPSVGALSVGVNTTDRLMEFGLHANSGSATSTPIRWMASTRTGY